MKNNILLNKYFYIGIISIVFIAISIFVYLKYLMLGIIIKEDSNILLIFALFLLANLYSLIISIKELVSEWQ
jgi:hypothetical protein